MPTKTGIEWTDFSSNPIRYRNEADESVWACVHVSDGCRFCYAERLALRRHRGEAFTAPNIAKVTVELDEKELHSLQHATSIKGRKVFIGDMTDIFGEWVPEAMIRDLFATLALRPDVTFQILTKRPERAAEILQNRIPSMGWPLPNVWIGTSVEGNTVAYRADLLRSVPAAVHFLSVEPLIEELALRDRWMSPNALHPMDWIICGGESGSSARPIHPGWVRFLRDRCVAYGVPFFFKQWGEWAPATHERATHLLKLDGTLVERSHAMVTMNGQQRDLVDRGHAGWARIWRPGKVRAGRMVDGITWSQFPKGRE